MLHLGFEMAEKGKMTEFLRQSRSQGKNMSSLSNYNIIKMLTDIAHGLSHLHQRNILHGDLRGKILC
jgi:serine/threonine protein kinase